MKKFTISMAIMALLLVPLGAQAQQLLIPGGQVIGLALENDQVTVAAFEEQLGAAAREAGLAVGDRITRVDETAVSSAGDVRRALERSKGQVEVSVLRKGKPVVLTLHPEITADGPRLGVYLKEGVTGVGTVTFYDWEEQTFGALGHGVNDSTGSLLEMKQGRIFAASVASVKKGKSGEPGQLVGALNGEMPLGGLRKNTVQGVFGKLDGAVQGQPIPVAAPGEIRTGEATIRSTVAGSQVREYAVEVVKVYPHAGASGRNMLLRVTDPALLEATGGIVQGMSGSPIIQDGKLVGAVTHVLVNDPTTGYGIFIENMLDAAA